MLFSHSMIVEHSTSEVAKSVEIMKVSEGLVYRIEVHFPHGSCGNLKVVIKRGSTQIWPTSIDGSFSGSGEIVAFDDMYLIEQPPYQFEIHAENYDNSFDHSCDIYIGVVADELFKARFMPTLAWEDFWKKWQALIAYQNEVYEQIPVIEIPTIII